MRPLLLPFVPLYGAGVAIRNWFFDIGLLRSHKVGVPVVSVGNLSAGGSGKTPLVELLAKQLMLAGRKVAIVSRGYKRESSGTLVVSNGLVQCAEAWVAGDEPAQMAAKLKGAVVIVDERRSRGAEYAIEKFGSNVIILDDGFQHRYLKRDLDIVVLPVAEVEDPGWMLPAGNRREPMTSLKRASLIALSRCESVEQFQKAKAIVERWTDKPVIGVTTKVSAFRRASSRFSVDLGGIKGKTAVAFSGIGSPDSFARTLNSLGLDVKKYVVFPDHHFYRKSELKILEHLLAETRADYCVTTEKDIARLSSQENEFQSFLEKAPLFFVEIEQSVIAGETELNEGINKL
ncbi:MAG: tetraacyldisaccharide 4'-kinase [Ignavibacteriales bacterium]|nr:tetraacyldisaccharide 4'-kinase [Ignavibacteriales bacterium]